MSYAIQFQLTDTIAAGSTLNSGATSTTLTSGNFASPSGTQLYVVDYDVPGSAEIISATVTGTAVTSITRGLTGGAAGTTNHAAGAKIGSIFVPQHYANGLGAVASNDAWTSYTPSWTAASVNPAIGNGTVTGSYFQLGKAVWYKIKLTAGSTTTFGTGNYSFSLPVTAAAFYASPFPMGQAVVDDTGVNTYQGSAVYATTTTVLVYLGSPASVLAPTVPFTFGNADKVTIQGFFEAA